MVSNALWIPGYRGLLKLSTELLNNYINQPIRMGLYTVTQAKRKERIVGTTHLFGILLVTLVDEYSHTDKKVKGRNFEIYLGREIQQSVGERSNAVHFMRNTTSTY